MLAGRLRGDDSKDWIRRVLLNPRHRLNSRPGRFKLLVVHFGDSTLQTTFLLIQNPAMSDPFDPYYIWLGIPPKDQPPSHYRLLGIQELEENTDVIDAAANRQTTYLHEMAAGPNRKESQKLLNEIAAARRCLLNPEQKQEYDAKLRAEHDAAQAAAVPVAQAVAPSVPFIDTGQIPGSELPNFDFSAGTSPKVAVKTDAAPAANSEPSQHAPTQKQPAEPVGSDADGGEDGSVSGKPIPRQWIITGCSVVVVAIIAFILTNGSDSGGDQTPASTSTRLDGSGDAVTANTSAGSVDSSPKEPKGDDAKNNDDDGLSLFDQVDDSNSPFKAPQNFGGNEKKKK